jgi:hypothetical protein
MPNIRKGHEKAMQKRATFIWMVVGGLLCLCGCTVHYVLSPDGEYDFRVPVARGDAQEGFESLLVSTVKVVWSPQYVNTFYSHDLRNDIGFRIPRPLPDAESPTGFRLLRDGIRETVDSYSKVGTALVIARQRATNEFDMAVALTTAHLVTAPDTIRYFMRDALGLETRVLERLSIKTSAALQVMSRDGESIRAVILRLDTEKDLALLKLDVYNSMKSPLPFRLPLGKASDLQWGNFVYIVGHPKNKMRLTAGTVSLDEQADRFFVDAAVRTGYSGGPVVAVRDGLPHFELVGLCRGATTETFRLLVPDRKLVAGTVLSPELLRQISVEEREVIEPGLGFVVGINSVKQFLLDSRDELIEMRMDVKTDVALRMWGF